MSHATSNEDVTSVISKKKKLRTSTRRPSCSDPDAPSSSSSPSSEGAPASATASKPQGTSTSDSSSSGGGGLLYRWIRRDVEPEGHQLLVPFLSTTDFLRMSECCQGLLPYRYFMSRVKIVSHRLGLRRMRDSVVRLLVAASARQRHHPPGLHYLQISHRSLIPWLQDLLPGPDSGCRALETLDLSGLDLKDEDAQHLATALLGSDLLDLKELVLSAALSELSRAGLDVIVRALADSATPRLQRLDLSNNSCPPGSPISLAMAIESGQWPCLQELDMASTRMRNDWVSPIAMALKTGGCTDLRKLKLECSLSFHAASILGEALGSGHCSRLQELHLSHVGGFEGLVPLMVALETGCCPDLAVLDIRDLYMTEEDATAMAQVLSCGACQHLQWLHIESPGTHPPDTSTLRVVEALKAGGCRALRHLGLTDDRMGAEHGRVLGEALDGGACPRLEELLLSGSKALGNEGIVPVMKALEAGRCADMRYLHLSGVGLKGLGAKALSEALAFGSLAGLQVIELEENQSIEDEAMEGIIRALASGTCPNLRSLSAKYSGACKKAGQAVIEAIRAGAWPRLETLYLMNKNLRPTWMSDLASALVEGGVGCKRLKKLHLRCGVTTKSFVKLAEAFRAVGCCPALKVLSIVGKVRGEVDDDSIEELERALQGRATVDVRKSKSR